MKDALKILVVLIFILTGKSLFAQNIDFTIRYNPLMNNFEVYIKPDFNDATFFVGAGSQISILLPASIADNALSINSINGGKWIDNSQVYAPIADTAHDFHSITSNGGPIDLAAEKELLLFTFQLFSNDCINGLRLFENTLDPKSSAPGMGGGDFTNYFADNFSFIDHYRSNYDNLGIICPDYPDINGCHFKTGTEISFEFTTDSTNQNYQEQFVLTDTVGQIIAMVDSLPFLDIPAGKYLAFSVKNDTTESIDNLTINGFMHQVRGNCLSISDPLPIGVCDCNNESGNLSIQKTGGKIGANYKEIYLLTNGKTEILQIDSLLNFDGLPQGVYNVYALNRDTSGELNNVEIGNRVSDITGSCFELSTPLGFVVCATPPILIPSPITTVQNSTGSICLPIIDKATDTISVTSCSTSHGTESYTLQNNLLCIDYIPDANYIGFDSVCLVVCDQNELCDTTFIPATVSPTLIPVLQPSPPIIIPNGLTTPKNTGATVCMPILDANPAATFTTTLNPNQPIKGAVIPFVKEQELCITYFPKNEFIGTDSISMIVCDETDLCDTATIIIQVIPTPATPDSMQAPVLVFPPIVGHKNDSLSYCGPIVDNSPQDQHTVSICQQPSNGVATALVNQATGAICVELIPAMDFMGKDSLCLVVCDTSNLCDTLFVPIIILPKITTIALKVMLQGALFGSTDSLMRDDLRNLGFLPETQPYNSELSERFSASNIHNATANPSIFYQNINTSDAIVDWVLLEFRETTDLTNTINATAAFVQKDGDIVSPVDGNYLKLANLPDSFFVAVKHRNHLGTMTAKPIIIQNNSATFDFTSTNHSDLYSGIGYDTLAMVRVNGKQALWAGNTNADIKTKYSGANNDQIKINGDILNLSENTFATLNYDRAFGYFQGDVNMDGQVKNDGAGNDRILIQNIILNYPLNFNNLILLNYNLMIEQLP